MWGIYRSKSAMQVNYIPATYKKVKKQDNKEFTVLDKAGALLLQGALGENRNYDWSKKLSFAISVNDLPALFEGFEKVKNKGKVGDKPISLVHDPNAGTSSKGQVTKTLSIKDGNKPLNYMLSIYEKNGSGSSNVYVSLGYGEMLMFYSLLNKLWPQMIGNK